MSVPNFITLLRIVGTVVLIFVTPLTSAFFWLHALCGITDVLDGAIARATKRTSSLGAKLDSVADLLFYAVMLLKLFPALVHEVPTGVWFLTGAVCLVRIASFLVAALKYHTFAALHTIMNKLTGFLVFLLPYVIQLPAKEVLCWIVTIIAGIASVEELTIHIRSQDYQPGNNIATMLSLKRPKKPCKLK